LGSESGNFAFNHIIEVEIGLMRMWSRNLRIASIFVW